MAQSGVTASNGRIMEEYEATFSSLVRIDAALRRLYSQIAAEPLAERRSELVQECLRLVLRVGKQSRPLEHRSAALDGTVLGSAEESIVLVHLLQLKRTQRSELQKVLRRAEDLLADSE
jgi:hypothetical protein